ncbi:hypothetical protein [Streptomyces sp. NPDC002526]
MNTADSAVAPKKQIYWRGIHVPWIAPWSAERTFTGQVIHRVGAGGSGIGYADELSHVDRRRGVLWTRQAVARGSGFPHLPDMHALRQRQATSHMLCQVCGGTTFDEAYERWEERHLFVRRTENGQPLVEGERTLMAPLHLPCAGESVDACPHLRGTWTAALVKYAQPWGVSGIIHHQETLQPLPFPKKGMHMVPIGHPAERWTIAALSVSTLHGVTPVSLGDLVAAA